MNTEKRVIGGLISVFLFFSTFGVFPEPDIKGLIRFSLSCLLCWFLYHGANWARIVMGSLSALAAIVVAAYLVKLHGQGQSVFLPAFLFAFYITATYILFSKKFVGKHFEKQST